MKRTPASPPLSPAEAALVAAVRAVRFGAVEVVVHDGRIVRLEKTEKLRFDDDPRPGSVGASEAERTWPPPDRRSPPAAPEGGLR